MTTIEWIVRPTEPEDAYFISRWRNEDCVEFLHDPTQYSANQTKKWIENLSRSSKRFTIETKGDSGGVFGALFTKSIGCIRIDHIDELNRNCYVGMDIAEPFRGKGLSEPLYNWIFNHVFNEMNMHVIYLEVLETNERAIHIYKKLGFKECGFYPEKIYRGDRHIDSLLFCLTKKQWKLNTKAGS